jgi:hypothetical protein
VTTGPLLYAYVNVGRDIPLMTEQWYNLIMRSQDQVNTHLHPLGLTATGSPELVSHPAAGTVIVRWKIDAYSREDFEEGKLVH